MWLGGLRCATNNCHLLQCCRDPWDGILRWLVVLHTKFMVTVLQLCFTCVSIQLCMQSPHSTWRACMQPTTSNQGTTTAHRHHCRQVFTALPCIVVVLLVWRRWPCIL
jgi:hypothetical protein